ncbi:hypothetical protein WN944_005821 [Citrus x changshan-huyou]|uniref:Leucine-rich repeat-containing N-terminal plant-type domain-containing protein n=1 Tax=Citrus x changshan-huyou TaxID=2935761 RepID=A0AAP0MI18_9ROSI
MGAGAVDYGLAVLGHQSSSLELKLALNGDVISSVRDPPFAIPLNGVVATMMMIIIIIIFLLMHTWPILLLFSVFVHFAAMVILGVHRWSMENDLCKIIRLLLSYSYSSWKPEEGNIDSCSWDGVQCNENTGRVIKVDLSTSCLQGSINSSSSLFTLVDLEWLDLSFNDFNGSEIPFINLSSLSH